MIDDYQRRERQKHLGSSDAAAVCGFDPYRTAGDVQLEKRGLLAPEKGDSPAIVVGRYVESAILDWLQGTTGAGLVRDHSALHANGILACNLDAYTLAPEVAVVEAKSAGMLGHAKVLDEYGEPGTDEVPDRVRIQAHHQLAVVRSQPGPLEHCDLVLVPALLMGRGFVLYRVPRDPELEGVIVETEERFWRDCVLGDAEPSVPPTLDVLTRRLRTEGKRVPIDPFLVEHWRNAKAIADEAVKLADQRKAELLAALGDAEIGECALGEITYKASMRKAYTVEESVVRRLLFRDASAKKKGAKAA